MGEAFDVDVGRHEGGSWPGLKAKLPVRSCLAAMAVRISRPMSRIRGWRAGSSRLQEMSRLMAFQSSQAGPNRPSGRWREGIVSVMRRTLGTGWESGEVAANPGPW